MAIDFDKKPSRGSSPRHSYTDAETARLRALPLDSLSFTGPLFRCQWVPASSRDRSQRNMYFAPSVLRGGSIGENGRTEETGSFHFDPSTGKWFDFGSRTGGDLFDLTEILMHGSLADKSTLRREYFTAACDFLAGVNPEIYEGTYVKGQGSITVIDNRGRDTILSIASSDVIPSKDDIKNAPETLFVLPEYELVKVEDGRTRIIDTSTQENIISFPSRKRETHPDGSRHLVMYGDSDMESVSTAFEDLSTEVSSRLLSGPYTKVVLCDKYMSDNAARYSGGADSAYSKALNGFFRSVSGVVRNLNSRVGNHAELSGTAPRPFSVYTTNPDSGLVKKDDYCSVSQYMCAEKARFMGDLRALELIMSSTNPAVYEGIAKDIIIPEERKSEWQAHSASVMRTAVYQSFEYNPDAKAKLLATGSVRIDCADPRMSKALMDVRNTFQLYETQKAESKYRWQIFERQQGFTDEALKGFFEGRGVSLEVADRFCEQLRIKHVSRSMTPEEIKKKGSIPAIGFPAKSGCYALRTPEHEKRIKVGSNWQTVMGIDGNPEMVKGLKNSTGADISIILAGGVPFKETNPSDRPASQAEKAYFVEGFMDALSIEQELLEAGKAQDFDLFVLNSTVNEAKALPFLEGYKEVHDFLDYDEGGRKCADFLRSFCEGKGIAFISESPKYFPAMEKKTGVKIKDYNEFLMAKKGLLKAGRNIAGSESAKRSTVKKS